MPQEQPQPDLNQRMQITSTLGVINNMLILYKFVDLGEMHKATGHNFDDLAQILLEVKAAALSAQPFVESVTETAIAPVVADEESPTPIRPAGRGAQ